MGKKYHHLANVLMRQNDDQITFTFAELETLLGAPLPAVAREQWWWINTPEMVRVPADAWLRLGWKASDVDTDQGVVTLVRDKSEDR